MTAPDSLISTPAALTTLVWHFYEVESIDEHLGDIETYEEAGNRVFERHLKNQTRIGQFAGWEEQVFEAHPAGNSKGLEAVRCMPDMPNLHRSRPGCCTHPGGTAQQLLTLTRKSPAPISPCRE